jgi:hypothetical protein
MKTHVKFLCLFLAIFNSILGFAQIIRIDGVGDGDVGFVSNEPCRAQGLTSYRLNFETRFPEEVSWNITDAFDNVVYSRSLYRELSDAEQNLGVLRRRGLFICLPDGCYTFQITDSAGNGLCCDGDSGSYVLSEVGASGEDPEVVAQGSSFGFRESTDFCTGRVITCQDGSEINLESFTFEGNQEGWLCQFTGGCAYYEGPEVISGAGSMELSGNTFSATTRVDSPPFFAPEEGRIFRVKFDVKPIANQEGDSYTFVAYYGGGTFIEQEYTFGIDYSNNIVHSREIDLRLPADYDGTPIGFRIMKLTAAGIESAIYIDNVDVCTIRICPEVKNTKIQEDKLERNEIAFNIFPNPANNSFQISTSCIDYKGYQIHNLSGLLIKSGTSLQYTEVIDLSSVKPGLYFVSLECDGGFFRKRLIVR